MTDGRELVLVAHPVSGDVERNVQRALRWWSALRAAHPETAFAMPWAVGLLSGTERDHVPEERERGLLDSVAFARRCNGIALCGGRVSSGMRRELDGTHRSGGWVCDLTDLGEEPPSEWAWLGESPLSYGRKRWGLTAAGVMSVVWR